MIEKFRLDNKMSMVTGGSKGIGFGIAKALAEAGSDIVLVARDKTDLDKAREELATTGRSIRSYSFDMSNVAGIEELFASVIKDIGGVDILVNNAGAARRGPAETISAEEWKTPQARWGKPDDLGNAAVYLASPASDYVTGHILFLDGGILSTFGPISW